MGASRPPLFKRPGVQGALLVRDILDGQLEARDHRKIGRVADVVAMREPDGSLRAVQLCIGPEALAGRISPRLRRLVATVLRGRFDHRIPVTEIAEVGPTVRLRGVGDDYATGRTDAWVAKRILRWIPGSGRPATSPLRER